MRKYIDVFFGVAMVLVAVVIVGLAIVFNNGGFRPNAERGLLTLELSLKDVTLDTVKSGLKSTKYPGNELSFEDENGKREFENVELKGRGNSTWGTEKPPFQIKFKEKVDLLGRGDFKTYVLLANYFDYTYLRNDMVYKLAEMIEDPVSLGGRFARLYIDDEYLGLYYLLPKIAATKNYVNMENDQGVLMELDTLHRDGEDCWDSGFGECFVLKDAVSDEDSEETRLGIMDFMDSFNMLEMAAKKYDFGAIREIVDVESFVRYFLVSEFSVNPDAYVSSFYFYKDGADDKIHAGPIWDFDFAFGNRNWAFGQESEEFFSPEYSMAYRDIVYTEENEDSELSKLMYNLMDTPEFADEVRRVFVERLSGKKSELEAHILQMVDVIYREAAVDSKLYKRGVFADEVKSLLDWTMRRYDYLEKVYGVADVEIGER